MLITFVSFKLYYQCFLCESIHRRFHFSKIQSKYTLEVEDRVFLRFFAENYSTIDICANPTNVLSSGMS